MTESDDDDADLPVKPKTKPIVLDDDDDDDDDIFSLPRPAPRKPVEVNPELSDEEFSELIQKAREEEKRRKLQSEKAKKSFEEKNHAQEDDIFDTDTSAAVVDPVVELLISSEIEGTKPILVKRKMSQKMREVKLAWCDKQSNDMVPHIKNAIFLTWKGKKLYDQSTCKAFNLKFDSMGKLAEREGIDAGGRIHLEAWTQDMYSAYQKTQAARAQRVQDGGEEEEVEKEVPVKKTKLFLKSRVHGEVKVSVKPSTPVQHLIDYFRKDKEISDNQEISMHLDGDKLDPETLMEDTELEDMDAVEVHIR